MANVRLRAAPFLVVLAAAPSPALAQDEAAASADPLSVASAEPAPALPAEPLWTAAVSAGISARDDGPDGSWGSLSLTRRIGRGYVRGSLMRYHGTLLQADVALPSDYTVGTIGAGGNFDNWVLDGWASYGRQDYGRISAAATNGGGSRSSTGAKNSPYWALGGDFGRVVPLGSGFYLTPTVAASFADGRLLRPAPTGSGLTDLETDEPTWSTNAAVRIDHAFGPSGVHYAGLSISRNWTSNGVSALRLRRGEQGFELDSKHYADGWSEAGATASMKLGRDLYLDLFATRSIGLDAGNITAAGMTLRKAF
jgi:hypothetical protein